MQVGQLIEGRSRSDIISCAPDVALGEAVRILAERRIGAMPVMEGDPVVGIISERDVLYCLAAEGASSLAKSVREVMTAEPITTTPDSTIIQALGLMTRRRVRHLPVTEGDSLVGFVSIGDLVKSRLDEISHEAEAMRDYIRMA